MKMLFAVTILYINVAVVMDSTEMEQLAKVWLVIVFKTTNVMNPSKLDPYAIINIKQFNSKGG